MSVAPQRGHMSSITEPEELWRKVVKWSLAAFLVTFGLVVLVLLIASI